MIAEIEDMITSRPLMPHELLAERLLNLEQWRVYLVETLEEVPSLKCDTHPRRYPKRKRLPVSTA